MTRFLVDTAIFLYAVGGEHRYREPCRELLESMRGEEVRSEASVELVQEIAHFMGRRGDARLAIVRLARVASATCRLHDFTLADLKRALELFGEFPRLQMRDAVHAATALNCDVDVIVATDRGFDDVPGLIRVDPSDERGIASLVG